jgi:hypothetical protein
MPIAFRPRSTSSPISSRYGSQALTDDFAAGPDAAFPFKKPVVTPMAGFESLAALDPPESAVTPMAGFESCAPDPSPESVVTSIAGFAAE